MALDQELQKLYAEARGTGLLDKDPQLHSLLAEGVKSGLLDDLSSTPAAVVQTSKPKTVFTPLKAAARTQSIPVINPRAGGRTITPNSPDWESIGPNTLPGQQPAPEENGLLKFLHAARDNAQRIGSTLVRYGKDVLQVRDSTRSPLPSNLTDDIKAAAQAAGEAVGRQGATVPGNAPEKPLTPEQKSRRSFVLSQRESALTKAGNWAKENPIDAAIMAGAPLAEGLDAVSALAKTQEAAGVARALSSAARVSRAVGTGGLSEAARVKSRVDAARKAAEVFDAALPGKVASEARSQEIADTLAAKRLETGTTPTRKTNVVRLPRNSPNWRILKVTPKTRPLPKGIKSDSPAGINDDSPNPPLTRVDAWELRQNRRAVIDRGVYHPTIPDPEKPEMPKTNFFGKPRPGMDQDEVLIDRLAGPTPEEAAARRLKAQDPASPRRIKAAKSARLGSVTDADTTDLENALEDVKKNEPAVTLDQAAEPGTSPTPEPAASPEADTHTMAPGEAAQPGEDPVAAIVAKAKSEAVSGEAKRGPLGAMPAPVAGGVPAGPGSKATPSSGVAPSLSKAAVKLGGAIHAAAMPSEGYAEFGRATAAQTRNRVVGKLSRTRSVTPNGYMSARQMAASHTHARAVWGTAAPDIARAMTGTTTGYGPAAEKAVNHFLTLLTEATLEGKRTMWQDAATSAAADPHVTFADYGSHRSMLAADADRSNIKDLLKNADAIHAEIVAADTAGDTAKSDTYKQFLSDYLETAHTDAASRVKSMPLPPGALDKAEKSANFQKAMAIYKDRIEKPLRESHLENSGIISPHLGRFDTYIPLNATDAPGGALIGPKGAIASKAAPYKDPGNPRNRFATGTAEGYDASIPALTESLGRAMRNNNRAALVDTLESDGYLQKVPHGVVPPDRITVNGQEYPASVVTTKEARTLISGGKVFTRHADRAVVPSWLHAEVGRMLDATHFPTEGETGWSKLAHAFNALNLAGPTDAVYHSGNILGVLVNNSPYIRGDVHVALRAIENSLPLKGGTAIGTMAKMDTKSAEYLSDVQYLSKIGGLPDKYATETYDPNYANITGASLNRRSLGPALYGPGGVDERARVLYLRVLRSINPKITDFNVLKAIDQFGVYSKEIEPYFESAVKRSGVSPFATAGNTMNRNALLGAIGMNPMGTEGLPTKTKLWIRMQQLAGGGTAGYITANLIGHYMVTGKDPTTDPKFRVGQIPVPQSFRSSEAGRAIFGPGSDTKYWSLGVFNPLADRAGRGSGITAALNATRNGADAGESAEAAGMSITNAAVHPYTSGPMTQFGTTAAFGVAPSLTGRDTLTGRVGVGLLPVARTRKPGVPQLAENLKEAGAQSNSIINALAGVAGVGREGEAMTKAKVPLIGRVAREGMHVIVPRVLVPGDPNNARERTKFIRIKKRTQQD